MWISDEAAPAIYHDAEHGDARTIDVAMDPRDTAYADHVAQDQDEQRGEELRLAYVALTRAKHQAVMWWATTHNSRESALGRLVFGAPAPDRASPTRRSARCRGARPLRRAGRRGAESIVLERALIARGARFAPQVVRAADLEAAMFDRRLDPLWRRMSYSSVTAGAYEARVASEVEEAAGADDAPDHHPLPLADTIGDEAGTARRPVVAVRHARGHARGHVAAPGLGGDRLWRGRPERRAVLAHRRRAATPDGRRGRPHLVG